MKKAIKFFVAALLTGMCSFGYAQDYKKTPKPNEKVIGTISNSYGSGDHRMTESEIYAMILEAAKKEFPNYEVDIREMKYEQADEGYSINWPEIGKHEWIVQWKGTYTCKVVDLHDLETLAISNLSQTLNKTLRNVREGSRLAIDQVSVISSMDRGEFKDQLIDVLLDKGYKVVAKEYLEKLYEEIKGQESGIYNDGTTVKPDNFSAVGYYINVKVTETSLRVQVVNVSTGEYEGNATVNF